MAIAHAGADPLDRLVRLQPGSVLAMRSDRPYVARHHTLGAAGGAISGTLAVSQIADGKPDPDDDHQRHPCRSGERTPVAMFLHGRCLIAASSVVAGGLLRAISIAEYR